MNVQRTEYIKKMYDGLLKNNMWKLSTGIVVEKMRDLALNKDHVLHILHYQRDAQRIF